MTPDAGVTFIGNATTLLRLGAFTVLTDPAFGPAGSRVHLGYGAWTRRLKDPAMTYADLRDRSLTGIRALGRGETVDLSPSVHR